MTYNATMTNNPKWRFLARQQYHIVTAPEVFEDSDTIAVTKSHLTNRQAESRRGVIVPAWFDFD